VTRGMEAVAVSFTATADVAGSSDKLDPNLRAFTAAVPSLPHPALARTRSVSRSRRSLGHAETCGLIAGIVRYEFGAADSVSQPHAR
jgi:hypothetical protein